MGKTLQDWKQSGKIHVWRYVENSKNFPGFHMSGDKAGVVSVAGLFEILIAADVGFARRVVVVKPTGAELAVPSNRNSAVMSPRKLVVSKNQDPDYWLLVERGEDLVLEVGANWFAKLGSALLGTLDGKGDFSLGKENNGSALLWFWWSRVEI